MGESECSDDPLAETVVACQQGDRFAQRRPCEHCSQRVYRLIVRMVGEQDAADVTQQAFLQAFRNIGRVNGSAKFQTWLYRVAIPRKIGREISRRGRSQHCGFLSELVELPQVFDLIEIPQDSIASLIHRLGVEPVEPRRTIAVNQQLCERLTINGESGREAVCGRTSATVCRSSEFASAHGHSGIPTPPASHHGLQRTRDSLVPCAPRSIRGAAGQNCLNQVLKRRASESFPSIVVIGP